MLTNKETEQMPNILDVLEYLQRKDATAPLTQWLDQRLQKYFNDGNKTLDICLGMRGQSERSFVYRYKMTQRNNYLREAHALCDGETLWKKSCQLEKEISKFQGIIWPRFRDLESVPIGTSSLRTALFNAFKLNSSIPNSARRIHDIVDLNL